MFHPSTMFRGPFRITETLWTGGTFGPTVIGSTIIVLKKSSIMLIDACSVPNELVHIIWYCAERSVPVVIIGHRLNFSNEPLDITGTTGMSLTIIIPVVMDTVAFRMAQT